MSISAVDREGWFTMCKIALQWVKGSRCRPKFRDVGELCSRRLYVQFEDGTRSNENVEGAVKETGSR